MTGKTGGIGGYPAAAAAKAEAAELRRRRRTPAQLAADHPRTGARLRHPRQGRRRQSAAVLGRVGALRLRDGRDPGDGGRRRADALDVPRRGGERDHHRALPRLRHPGMGVACGRGVVEAVRPVRLRPVRPALRRSGPAKLLEYNADTPTSLLEAAVVQWFWKTTVFPDDDQWNSIHEKLVARWREIGAAAAQQRSALHLVQRGHHRRGPRHRSATCRRPRPRAG